VLLSRHDKLCFGHHPFKIGGQKTSKIQRDLGKPLTLSANVFETNEDIDKL